MTSLFDVGKSALNSYRQSLAVTGQNIANINTEGYKRAKLALKRLPARRVALHRLPTRQGLGFVSVRFAARLTSIC